MSKLKKSVSIICVLVMLLGLMAGCSTSKSAGGTSDSSNVESGIDNQAQDKEIGEDAALEIALKDAGMKESDVTVTKVKLDYDDDDGTNEYEIEFRDGTYEYEYTIDPYTGEILEKDKDIDD